MGSEKEKHIGQEAAIALTPTDLEKIIAGAVKAAVEEAKKPVVSEAEQRQIETDQQIRRDQAAQIKADMAQKKAMQRICSHKHRDGQTHCVYIPDGNYILCQKCQVKIRPEAEPKDYKGTDIYDVETFNEIFQTLNTELYG